MKTRGEILPKAFYTILLNIKTEEIGLWQPEFFLTQTPTFPNPVNPQYGNVAGTFGLLNGFLAANNIILRFTRLDGSYTTAKQNIFQDGLLEHK